MKRNLIRIVNISISFCLVFTLILIQLFEELINQNKVIFNIFFVVIILHIIISICCKIVNDNRVEK